MSLGIALLLLAQGAALPPGYVLDPPPCPNEQATCKPWERTWPKEPNPFEKYRPKLQRERLGPGPHTLVISGRDGMTRIDYATGVKCQRARDEIRRQTAPPPDTASMIYGQSSVKAFCVPR